MMNAGYHSAQKLCFDGFWARANGAKAAKATTKTCAVTSHATSELLGSAPRQPAKWAMSTIVATRMYNKVRRSIARKDFKGLVRTAVRRPGIRVESTQHAAT